jgi:Asp-tRNA(Asn)/Glu-tRNA(Gln) amidotransferase A subunit family amidase
MADKMQPSAPYTSVTTSLIEHAEKLAGLTFTQAEREMMIEELVKRLGNYEQLRAMTLQNEIMPPLHFNPQVPGAGSWRMPRIYPVHELLDVERPADLEEAAFYPVTRLSALIRSRKVTSVELTEMYLARLRRYDPYLQCVVTYTDDLAMQQARRADAEIAAGRYRGPLHGIPWGAKDLLATRDYPTTWGAPPYRNQMIDMDATVVRRLEEAGAVLIAKLTLGALAYGDVWFGGMTKNPWDLSEGSSGSSAGSASAAAAGLVGFSIGTETLGSIVSPSTRCGAAGLRPTFGRVSRYGAMMLCASMDKIGPICRTVEDCALVLTAIYGPDGYDLAVADRDFVWQADRDIRDLRIGYIQSAFEQRDADAPPEIVNNDAQVLAVLRSLGVDLTPIELPAFDMEALSPILLAEAAAAFDELTLNNLDDQMVLQDKEAWPNLMRAARFIPAVEYIQANRARAVLMQRMAALMEQVDVFVVPSFGDVLPMTNYTGHPAVVVPNGFTAKGTPTSVTFIGGLYKEADALAAAKAYQDATDFHLKHPPLNFE